jgi:two-component system OmpR family sensor kinase
LWRRTPLWARLVGAASVLVAVALLITGWIGVGLLRSYLTKQVDDRLVSSGDRFIRVVEGDLGGLGPDLGGSPGFRLPNSYVFEVINADGTRQGNPIGGPGAGPTAPDLSGLTAKDAQARDGRPYTVVSDGTRWRVVLRVVPDGSGRVLATMTGLGEVDRALNHLMGIELLVGLIALVALAGLGVLVVRLSLRPLGEIETTAEAIGAGDLSRRIPDADPRTEVGRLGSALNAMLGQIEHAAQAQATSEHEAHQTAERMRRFAADASHELRTPLTSIRGFAELHRQRGGGTAEETDRLVSRIESEATRMTGLVEDLLLLARLDQQRPLATSPVDLVPLAQDAAFDLRTLDPDRGVTADLPTDPLLVHGDASRLRQVFANLVGNVRTHTPATAAARIVLRREPYGGRDWALIEVADDGPGLTEEQASQVFERFYRVDDARARSHGGAGLGLSIVAALAAAHGGGVEAKAAVGEGATFRVWLPLAAPDAPLEAEPDTA